MAPAGTDSLNSIGSRSRSSTVITIGTVTSGSKAVVDSDVWFQGRSQSFGVDGELVKIRRFILFAAHAGSQPKAPKQWMVDAQVEYELRQQLGGQASIRNVVHIG